MIRRVILMAGMILSVVVPLLQSAPAAAAPFAGPEHQGYFLNKVDDWGGRVLKDGIHPKATPLSPTGKQYVESFISLVEDNLSGKNGTTQNQTGAEFLILSMLGYPADTNKTKAHQAAVIAKWEDTVRYYSDNNWVTWNAKGVSYVYNTYWQGDGSGSNPDDDAYFTESATVDDVIVFNAPGQGGVFRIKQECGNPIGDNTALKPRPKAAADLDLSVSADQQVLAGQTYRLNVNISNDGDVASMANGKLELTYTPAASVVVPCSPACNPTIPAQMGTLTNSGNTIQTFRSTSLITTGAPAPPNAPNWYWNASTGVAAQKTASTYIYFTVAIGAPAGSTIKFNAYYSPGNTAAENLFDSVTYTVLSVTRTPNFVGTSGDIHAGACTGVNSNVTGESTSGSYGQYAVSATGTVNGVASNGLTGGQTLTLGNYREVCRPDLLTAANNARAAYTTLATASVDVGTLTADTYFYDGSILSLYGTVNRKLTIVVPTGSVKIINTGIKLTTATALRSAQPSLGIIASGDIDIDPSVTEVNAYLFSDGTINTCTPGATAPACANTLTVNGFLMGQGLALNRTGPAGSSGSQAGEIVKLTPQLYLNPPRFFDDEVDDLLLEGQGEERPLF